MSVLCITMLRPDNIRNMRFEEKIGHNSCTEFRHAHFLLLVSSVSLRICFLQPFCQTEITNNGVDLEKKIAGGCEDQKKNVPAKGVLILGR